MAQDVHLQNIVVDRVEIEVGRFPGRRLVVGRVLNRREVVNFHVVGHDDDPGRVLAGRPLDPGRPAGQPVLFGAAELNFLVAFVGLDVTVGGLIGDRPDRAGPVNVIFTEQDLHVVVGDRLVVP